MITSLIKHKCQYPTAIRSNPKDDWDFNPRFWTLCDKPAFKGLHSDGSKALTSGLNEFRAPCDNRAGTYWLCDEHLAKEQFHRERIELQRVLGKCAE